LCGKANDIFKTREKLVHSIDFKKEFYVVVLIITDLAISQEDIFKKRRKKCLIFLLKHHYNLVPFYVTCKIENPKKY
jgi:hypothetical protein